MIAAIVRFLEADSFTRSFLPIQDRTGRLSQPSRTIYPALAGVTQCCSPCGVCLCHPILLVKPRLERKTERGGERKIGVRGNLNGGETEAGASLLITALWDILGIRHTCVSTVGQWRTRGHLKEDWEWVWQRSKLCERGHKRSLS